MYQHEYQLGQLVTIRLGWGDEVDGIIVSLWEGSAYVTVQTEDGERYSGPEQAIEELIQ